MRLIYGLSAVALVAWTSIAAAQNARDPARPATPVRAAVGGEIRAATADQQIAAILHTCCRTDVEFSQFIQDKLQSPEAREYCARVIAEHSAACDKLAKFAGGAVNVEVRPGLTPGEARREDRREDRAERREAIRDEVPAPAPRAAAEAPRKIEVEVGGTQVEVQPGVRPRVAVEGRVGAVGAQLDWVSIHKQIADQCLATAKKEFAAKEGEEVDRCYLGMQVAGHLKTMDEIKVLRNYASAELRPELEACLEGCQAHLDEAKALAKKLEDGAAARVSRKVEEAPKPE